MCDVCLSTMNNYSHYTHTRQIYLFFDEFDDWKLNSNKREWEKNHKMIFFFSSHSILTVKAATVTSMWVWRRREMGQWRTWARCANRKQKSTEVFIHLSFKTLNARMRHDEYEIPNIEEENRLQLQRGATTTAKKMDGERKNLFALCFHSI